MGDQTTTPLVERLRVQAARHRENATGLASAALLEEAANEIERAAMSVASVSAVTAERHVRHLKRGSVYAVLGAATAQVSRGTVPASGTLPIGRILRDDATVVVYVGADGRLWVRFPDEMNDGRFETIAPGDADAMFEAREK